MINESTPDDLIEDDFTINTYAQEVLSVQYARGGPAQVPFILGVRGPASLRGRLHTAIAEAAIVSTSKNKE
jgi:hypothetical protein